MSRLLAIDVGNTNTVVGLFAGQTLAAHWRLQTAAERTSDELAVVVKSLLSLRGFEADPVDSAIVSTVVPPALPAIERMCKEHFEVQPLVVGPGIKTGMPILYENPREVGADRIVNAVAAYDKYHSGVIAVDFGTATTWDVVTPKGEYLGGIIAPGIGISSEALYRHASKLPRVEIARPARVVGRNTVASMQSGLLYGYAGMVDSVVNKIREELDFETRCLATGGLAPLIAVESRAIEETDELLTLRGLKALFDRNA